MKLNSRKIGTVLAVVFFVGLTVATIYSRSFAERQKPLVQIAMSSSADLHWQYETRTIVRSATEAELERSQDLNWVVEITVPYVSFSNYMGELVGTAATITTDGTALFPTPLRNLMRLSMDNGDVWMSLGLPPHINSWDGEGAVVNIELVGITSFSNLIPPEALHKDEFTGQQYIFLVERHDGAWGAEFFVQKRIAAFGLPLRVKEYVLLTSPDLSGRVFVVSSKVPLSDGQAVRIFD